MPEASCGVLDVGSVCVPVPGSCGSESAPVCGCDNKTYPNPCEAARAKVGLAGYSACP